MKRELLSKLSRASYAGLLLAWASGYLARHYWGFELSTHFKPQFMLGSLAYALLFKRLRLRSWQRAALCCAALNGLHVFTWYLPPGQPPAGARAGRPLKLLLSNLFFMNRQYESLFELVRAESPDVIVVQEVSPGWAAALEGLRDGYPYGTVISAEDAGGIGVLSRLPLLEVADAGIGVYNGPSLQVSLLFNGRPIHLLASHTPPPMSRSHLEARNRNLRALADRLRATPDPKILVGDLNCSMWSPYYADAFEGLGMVNARQGFGLLPTWPTWVPLLLTPLDHCLTSRDLRVRDIRTGPYIGSDHLPLIVELETE